MNNSEKKKMPKDNLVWMNPETGASFHAGIAFYDEERGDYRAILDGPRTVLYFRPHEASSEETKYRVLAPISVKGQFSHMVEMGHGYSNPNTKGQIFMTIGRYEPMRLVLVPSEAA